MILEKIFVRAFKLESLTIEDKSISILIENNSQTRDLITFTDKSNYSLSPRHGKQKSHTSSSRCESCVRISTKHFTN